MRVLVVDPIGEAGHKKFNTYTLKMLSSFCDVEFLSTEKNVQLAKGICNYSAFPSFFSKMANNRFLSRVALFFRSKYAFRFFYAKGFDVIYFLSYETISLAFLNFGSALVWVHDHNNIDETLRNSIKKCLFRHLSSKAIHVVYEPYMKKYLNSEFQSKAFVVPHPSYLLGKSGMSSGSNNVVFSPSATYSLKLMAKLEEAAEAQGFILWAKGKAEYSSSNVEKKQYFDDYNDRLERAGFVCIVNELYYRVSGVMYEALGQGKMVLAYDCFFAREMAGRYPNLVFVVKDMSSFILGDFINTIDRSAQVSDFYRFVESHSGETIVQAYKMLMACHEE